jgi:hypothetical protein
MSVHPSELLTTDDAVYVRTGRRLRRLRDFELITLQLDDGDRTFMACEGTLMAIPEEWEALCAAWWISQELGS